MQDKRRQRPPGTRYLRRDRRPDIFTTRIDMEICICGARRWVDQDGAPATPWRSINLGTSPMEKEDAGVAPRDLSQVSAGRSDHLRELRKTDGPGRHPR